MSKAEFPGFDTRAVLDDSEIEDFVKRDILAAAVYFWGTDFRNPAMLDENADIYAWAQSPNGEDIVALSIYLQDESEMRQDDDRADDYEPELSIIVEMEALRPDLMDILPRGCKGLNVWECLTYRFPVDGSLPTADGYYNFENAKGAQLIHLSSVQEQFMDYISESDEFSLDRDSRLDFQDCLDIHNILLQLGVDESVLDLHGASQQPE